MKTLGFFEMRDNLLVQILRNDLSGDTLMSILDGVSFEALSNSNKFRDQ